MLKEKTSPRMPDSNGGLEPNVKAARYTLVESRFPCLKCRLVTPVFALALPAGYQSLIVDDDTPGDECGNWEPAPMAALLSYVEYLPEAVAHRVRGKTVHLRLDLHAETGQTFWMNHCEHCGVQIEEEELHEFEGPFGPMPCEGLEAIRLHEVREPFVGWAGGETHVLKRMDS